jgi:hypothetical protein
MTLEIREDIRQDNRVQTQHLINLKLLMMLKMSLH